MRADNQRTKSKNKLILIIIVVSFVIITCGVLGFLFQDKITSLVSNKSTDSRPKFVFDSSKLPDWASTGYVRYDDNHETIGTISAQQCTSGSNCSGLVEKCRVRMDKSNQACQDLERYTADGCMVQAFYAKGSINPDTAIENDLKKWSGSGINATEIATENLTMKTSEGDKQYTLHLYNNNNSDDSYKKGSAVGFVSLSDANIEVRSVCWKPSQLHDTLPALNAISLED